MSHFKAVATAVTTVSTLRKGKAIKCFPSFTNFENAVDKQHIIPPHIHASKGDLHALKASINAFCLSLKERGNDNSTLLHHAARSRQLAIMEFLVEKEIDLDAVDNSGNTALHLSVMACHVDGIHLLLKAGASCSLLNNDGNSPLHLAAKELTGETFKACLAHPVDIYLRGPRNRTFFHIISETDNIEACKFFKDYSDANNLVSNECEATEKLCVGDDDGFTPVHLAARKNSHKILEQVFNCWKEKGYSVESVFDLINEENSTALHVAVDGGNYEVACVLLKFGAKPCILKNDMTPPLHLACSLGRLDIVKAMVEHRGAGILHKMDCYQRTPLHYSVLSIHSVSIISYILSEGDNIDIDKPDSKGKMPLHLAISAGNLCSMKELLKRGASPFFKDNNGCNALHLAVQHDRKPIIHELLEIPNSNELITDVNCKGYSPIHIGLRLGLGDIMLSLVSSVLAHCNSQCLFSKDCHGNNYVHLAAASGDSKLLLEFLDLPDAHRLLNATNDHGGTPLHSAALKGQSRCIELLLNRGAMVHKCYKGITPLMITCSNGYMDCAKLLYKAHPFQIDWQDDTGDTALHHAAKSCSPPMIQYILDHRSKISHNDDGKSFLDIIIDSGNEDGALAVVNHKRWQECLDTVSPVDKHPMLKLVQKMPTVATAVLDRCYNKEKNSYQGVHTEVYNFKYLFAFDNTHLESVEKDTAELVPPLHRRKSIHKLGVGEFDVEAGPAIVNYKRSSTRKSLNVQSEEKKKSSATMEVLQTMVRYKRIDLLVHPVVKEYVQIKWKNYGQFFYYLLYISVFLHTILLSIFVVYGSTPSLNTNNSSIVNDMDMSNESTRLSQDLLQVNDFGKVVRWIALATDILVIIHMLTASIRLKFNFLNVQSFFCFMSTFFSLLFLLHPNPFKSLWIGSIACFFSWLLIFGSLKFASIFGIYVTIFFKILRRAFLVLFLSVFLIIAFALPLFLLTKDMQEFSTFGSSMFMVFGYMLGEIQYESFIARSTNSDSPLLVIIVIVLAIMMTIVMANLLIGLAVGDIEQSKLSALYDGMVLTVDYLFKLDEALPKFLHRKMLNIFIHPDERNQLKFYHRKTVGYQRCKFQRGLRTFLTMGRKALDSSVHIEEGEASGTTIVPPADTATELTQIKTKLQEISEILRLTQADKDNSFDYYHRWKGRRFRWQMPESSSASLLSSHSDLSDVLSDMS